jgi:predicted RNA-binding Zn-ribbon protein involved in translation (DUF1610 family)
MKVIKAASFDWSQAVTCHSCGSELEVELADLKRTAGCDPRTDESWDYAEFVCPVCKRGNRLIDYAGMPAHVRDRIAT